MKVRVSNLVKPYPHKVIELVQFKMTLIITNTFVPTVVGGHYLSVENLEWALPECYPMVKISYIFFIIL